MHIYIYMRRSSTETEDARGAMKEKFVRTIR